MHARRSAQPSSAADRGPRLWLIAGTGEGPQLASALLARGWRLRVSVVTAAAARAYPAHAGLELRVGALGQPPGGSPGTGSPAALTSAEAVVLPAAEAVAAELAQARRRGDPFRWVVDASHPFAQRITAALVSACAASGQPLLRLSRPWPPLAGAELLADPGDLGERVGGGEALLLAIGARRLAEAVAASPGAVHHARVLPYPAALQQALAAGLAPERLACLWPGAASEEVTAALCRQWRIRSVLCRQSGGEGEAAWHRLCARLGLRLLLLRRPEDPAGLEAVALEPLLTRIGWPLQS